MIKITGGRMYVVREILHCKPGKVRQMTEKFKAISMALTQLGHEPLRLLTDVSGEPFWTIVAEAKVNTIDQFFSLEQQLMTNEAVRNAMVDYHDLVESAGAKSIASRVDVRAAERAASCV